MDERDSLGLYLHWLAERRKDDEARLKRLGLSWKGLDLIESEALTQFPDEGMMVDGYKFVAGTRTRHVFPESIGKNVTKITERFITIHKE